MSKRAKTVLAVLVLAIGIVVWHAIPPDDIRFRDVVAPVPAFNPLVQTVAVEPTAEYQAYGHITSRTKQVLQLKVRGRSDGVGNVTVWATGAAPVPSGEPMPDINGRRAVWTDDAVAWEWAPDSWAFVDIVEFDGERESAHLFARHLTFGHHKLTSFPYTVRTTWRVASVITGDGGRLLSLEFENGAGLSYFHDKPSTSGTTVPPGELRALEDAVRPADPPVSNPLR